MSAKHHSSFEFKGRTEISSLNLAVEHYEHKKTGAVHYHLASENQEKVFLVALRTMPKDSTGVAHILEHTALCGSEKYPVRDPFFMMTRRSLNTFMNAMTSSDWTAYPFASQNDKDFDNLLGVYLDAVFFARLDEMDFAQEGHRIEFAEEGNKDSGLAYKGVVFNEMKGAMSSVTSQLWQNLSKYLFPSNTYHYNSGGEPAEITELSYQQLKNFYKSHYHPSNAIFMTFGDMDTEDLQDKMDKQALAQFEKQDQQWSVPLEQRFSAPVRIEESYALEADPENPDASNKTHHVLSWLLGESADLKSQLQAHLMSQVLLDNSASPLRKALEKCEFATAPSPMCGLEDSNREMSFMCGIEGSNPEDAGKFEQLVFEVLNEVAQNGVDQEHIESAMHQLEFHQREIGGDHYPYGMQLIFSGLSAATHYGDPVAMINLEPALEELRAAIKQPGFFADLVRSNLLDNCHFVRLSMKPDAKKSEREQQNEQAKLDRIEQGLTDADKQKILDQAAELKARQLQEDDGDILPSVGLEDIPANVKFPDPDDAATNQKNGLASNATSYSVGTNGIVYQQIMADLPVMNLSEVQALPLLAYTWTETGTQGSDYLAQQQKQASLCGGLSSYGTVKPIAQNSDSAQDKRLGYYTMSGKALASNTAAFGELMQETWAKADFSDEQRLTDMVGQLALRRVQGITGNGHGLAMQAATARVNQQGLLSDQLSGLPLTKQIKSLHESIEKHGASELSNSLQNLHGKIIAQPKELLLVQDTNAAAQHAGAIKEFSGSYGASAFELGETLTNNDTGFWLVDSQVNFCSTAYATVNQLHPDAPALAVAAGILRNGFLHTAIREQGGAYGAGASQDSSLAVFKFYSYRDPRIEGTLDDFKASIDWLIDDAKDESLVEQSILGIIGSMDRPGSPAGEAKINHHALKAGRTIERRQQYRAGLLAVTLADVKRVAEQYLKQGEGKTAVVAPKTAKDIAQKLGLNSEEL